MDTIAAVRRKKVKLEDVADAAEISISAASMVRTPTHKFIHNIGDRSELYDLIDDPRETHNLSGKPEYRELEIELQTQLNQWMDEQGDDQPRCEVSEFSIEDDEENGDNANEDSLSGA